MLLKDVMTTSVEVVHPDATLQEAAQKMKDLDVGPVPVCDGERPTYDFHFIRAFSFEPDFEKGGNEPPFSKIGSFLFRPLV